VRDAEAKGIDVTDPGLAEVIGLAYATCEAARSMNYAAVNERVHHPDGGRHLSAVSRTITGPMETTVAQACHDILGEEAMEAGTDANRQLITGTSAPIAAGSLEVQLNLIARSSLGLPNS
ncbi:MAG: acyl-CoA dehydrogenase, partial [Acidimicrobiia bacterium]|nr:acyl-CoA dehydrogenase [Acidimicrobiia bacterium]